MTTSLFATLGVLATLGMVAMGCAPDCACTCWCVEAGERHEDTVTVEEEADCEGECEGYPAENCPNFSSEGFSVDCS